MYISLVGQVYLYFFSVLASKSGFENIYSCESSEVMCEIQRKVLCANNVDSIKLMNTMSTNLEVGKDIKER